MQATRRIGLLGGSFDPVHLAHVTLAETALRHLQLDAVHLVPAAEPWQRPPLGAAPQHRAAMLELAIAGHSGLVVNQIELARGGPSYTIDTVEALKRPDTCYVLILGADQVANFCTWHRWEDVITNVDLAVAARAGDQPDVPEALATWLARHGRALQDLPMPAMTVSASTIRRRLAQGEPVDDLISPAVLDYIRSHRLYGTT
ncbi:nicotinate (nicotinamide) nucleotide adenylyltransferase [Pigmentiphaga aceris]|uniref:Probable nicotinate-nucleotide adenylyltransferase n=1 Tax=Pigmentiphaga aceris TaxID=1940612 RepID=A0A5C0B3U3_9BURK|nr:nicotinate (nicotinamide) nucleotide adenylyltransferase [Pigmentiphaga aceris]